MVRRTHHLTLWLFAFFVGYLLLVRGVITWAQMAPNQVDGVVEWLTDSQVHFQRLEIDQNWLGVSFTLEGLLVENTAVEFEVERLAVDLNLFSPLIPNARWGDFLEIEQLVFWKLHIPQAGSAEGGSDQPPALNSQAFEDWIAGFNLNRLWTRVNVTDFSLASFRDGVGWSVDIAHFQAFKGNNWSLATDVDVSYGEALHHEQFMLKGTFTPNVWGSVEQGQLAITSFQPLSVQGLAELLPQKWREVLPRGELMLDLQARMAKGRLADMDLNLYAQALHWPEHNPVLPKSLGVYLEWENQAQVRDLSRIDWRFAVSRMQMDSRFIETLSPIELSLSQNRKLHFATQKFDIEPFKPMLHALLKNEKVADLFRASVALALHNMEGDLDVHTLFLDNFSVEIAKLAVPVTHLPGLAMEQVYIDKRGSAFQVLIDKPFWVMEPRIHPIPMRFALQKRLYGSLDLDARRWQLTETALDWDQMPVSLQAEGGFEGELQASVKLEPATLDKVKAYLPYSLMSPKLQTWLKTALVSGHSVKGELAFNGNLNDFPFTEGASRLTAVATVKDTVLQFQPNWPALKKFDARIEFSPYKITVVPNEFTLAKGLQADKVVVEIDNLHKKDIAVRLKGEVGGDAEAAVAYLQQTPLLHKMGVAELLADKQRFELQGPLKVNLEDVWIPVYGFNERDETVKGTVVLDKGRLKLYDTLDFTGLQGEIAFTESSAASAQVKGTFEKGPFTMKVRTNSAEKQVVLALDGRAQPHYEHWVSGLLPWAAEVQIGLKANKTASQKPTGRVAMNLALDGTQANWHLPAPFDQAGMAVHATHQLSVFDDRLELQGRNPALGVYHLKLLEEAGKPYKVVGAVKLGGEETQAILADDRRLVIQGRVNRVDLDAWRTWQGMPLDDKEGASWQSPVWGASRLKIDEVKVFAQNYGTTIINWQNTAKEQVSIHVAAPYLQGVAQLNGKEQLSIQLSKLHLKTDNVSKTQEMSAEESEQAGGCVVGDGFAKGWPSIHFGGQDIVVDDIALSNLTFRADEVKGTFHVKAIEAELANQAGKVSGQYFFHRNTLQSSTEMHLTSKDVGALTRLLHMKKGFEGKKGLVKVNLTWPGGLECFNVASLLGKTQFTVEEGVVESVEPGFARLLGLLNITSLARRLSLNLSDVTAKGLVYDSIVGSAYLKEGLLHLESFKLKAPSVSVGLKGHVNLSAKQFDLQAEVTPALGSSLTALSALTGIASPFAALAVYTLMKIIPDVNEDLVSYKYDVTGPWLEPIIKER